NTDSGRVELRVLTGQSNFQAFKLQVSTPIELADAPNGDFVLANFGFFGVPDLAFVKRRQTASGKIEVHVLGSRSNYQDFMIHSETALPQLEDANGDFLFAGLARDLLPDLVFVKRRNTGTGTVEIHVLTGFSQFSQFATQTGTLIQAADETNGTFALGDFDTDGREELY